MWEHMDKYKLYTDQKVQSGHNYLLNFVSQIQIMLLWPTLWFLFELHQWRNGQHAYLKCGRSWVRAQLGVNQTIKLINKQHA
jgi:hypothetical protein